ncbi:MAG: hypothetical protein JXR83_06845 [Deltaproteobacteria bacterium]|nr:hypothetical protein [Deltaproteobacteria bacterium]
MAGRCRWLCIGEEDCGGSETCRDGLCQLVGDAGFLDREAGRDAGRDAGDDAGRDAGDDAGRDAGDDAGDDAGHDAGGGVPDASFARHSLVTATASSNAIAGLFQRKSFAAAGRIWVFYRDGSHAVFRSSADGALWSDPTILRTVQYSEDLSVWYRDPYLHYAASDGDNGTALHYRRGLPSSDGSIAWSADEQAIGGTDPGYKSCPMIAVDSSGRPWIGYRWVDGAEKRPRLIRSSSSDGTWSTSGSWELASWTAAAWFVELVPLSDDRMWAGFASGGHFVRAGVVTGDQVSSIDLTEQAISVPFSAVGSGDDVHVVFLSASSLVYARYDTVSKSFSTDVLLSAYDFHGSPVLGLDTAADRLYCLWSDPVTEEIAYRVHVGGGWEAQDHLLADESSTGIADAALVTAFYRDGLGVVGLFYLTGNETAPQIRFAAIPAGL